jgi:hypothetical protein
LQKHKCPRKKYITLTIEQFGFGHFEQLIALFEDNFKCRKTDFLNASITLMGVDPWLGIRKTNHSTQGVP